MRPQSKINGLFLGVLLPYIALVMFFAHSHHGRPLPTWLIYLGVACVVAIVVVSRRIVRSAKTKSTVGKDGSERQPVKAIWFVINASLIALSMWRGYVSLAPEQLRHVNPDAVLCSLILLGTPLFALGTVRYSVRVCSVDRLRRPSLDRNPVSWWYDPLQSLFITTCNIAAMAVGSLLHGLPSNSVAFWMIATYFCITFGLVIGQALVYRVYRARVVAAW